MNLYLFFKFIIALSVSERVFKKLLMLIDDMQNVHKSNEKSNYAMQF